MNIKQLLRFALLYVSMLVVPTFVLAQSPCTITQLPYSAQFNSAPECWAVNSTFQDNSASFLSLRSPMIDSSIAMNTLQVRFKIKNKYEMDMDTNAVVIGVCTDPTDQSTYMTIDTLGCAWRTYQEVEIPLTDCPYMGGYIFLRSSLPNVLLRDLVIEEIPNCHNPNDLTVDTVFRNTASISWRSRQGETAWEYALCHLDEQPITWTTTSDTSITFQNLDYVTNYGFYLRPFAILR